MAKIAKHQVMILGEYLELPINVSSKGEFSTIIPYAYRSIGSFTNSAKTKDELIKSINSFVQEVNEAHKSVELIIAYRLSNRVSPFASSAPDAGITLSFEAYKVEITGKNKSYYTIRRSHPEFRPIESDFICEGFQKGHYTYPGNKDSINPETDFTIPFTPDAYVFLENSVAAIKAIYTKLEAFLSPEAIQQSIAAGSQKLLN